MSPIPPTPIVAIVGRPNVGKSTLFNRYTGRRRALVEETPGLTRDRIVEAVSVAECRVLVVDTAGLEPAAEAGLPAAVQAQARAAVAEADAIVFVVDGKAGLLPQDEAIARELRRTSKPLAVAVNKIDAPSHALRVTEFERLGFERVRAVSAEHGAGAWELLEALVAELGAPSSSQIPGEGNDAIHVAIVGRPNVGKSLLLNRLVGDERAVVSEEAGTTRDPVDTLLVRDGERYLLVDTAGLRRPGRRDRVGERASAFMAIRAVERAEVALVVIDADAGVADQDLRIAGLVRERGCAAALIANKWDLLGPVRSEAAKRLREEIGRRLRFMAGTPLVSVSAKTGTRVERIFPLVRRLAAATRQRIATAELNRWLTQAVASHEPAMAQRGSRRRPVKFFYATQTGIRPPTFVLFCSDPGAVQSAYVRYLENRLRERFGFEGTPLRLQLRSRT